MSGVNVLSPRGDPRDVPPDPVPVGVQPRDQRAGDEREGDVAGVEVREVRELVEGHRGHPPQPSSSPGWNMEMIFGELRRVIKQVEQQHKPVPCVYIEDILALPAPLGIRRRSAASSSAAHVAAFSFASRRW